MTLCIPAEIIPHMQQPREFFKSSQLSDRIADVLNYWARIAAADPAEIVQSRRLPCRHCYGIDHQYQWDEAVYAMECAKAFDTNSPPPRCEGGFGYDVKRVPNEDCPLCAGDGITRVRIADTRYLSGNARYLYAGVKLKNNGAEIVMHDQLRAVENIAKHLGMFKNILEIKPESFDLSKLGGQAMSDIEAAKIYQQVMNE